MPVKKALVIGNADYTGSGLDSLPTCTNDSLEVGRVLKENFGFDVTRRPDCNYQGLASTLRKFVNRYRTDERRNEHGRDVVRSQATYGVCAELSPACCSCKFICLCQHQCCSWSPLASHWNAKTSQQREVLTCIALSCSR